MVYMFTKISSHLFFFGRTSHNKLALVIERHTISVVHFRGVIWIKNR